MWQASVLSEITTFMEVLLIPVVIGSWMSQKGRAYQFYKYIKFKLIYINLQSNLIIRTLTYLSLHSSSENIIVLIEVLHIYHYT